ncbi:MAG: hypothetical protein WDO06_04230 [Actinomycetota bacterium]
MTNKSDSNGGGKKPIFFEIPEDISTMSDTQLLDWVEHVIDHINEKWQPKNEN